MIVVFLAFILVFPIASAGIYYSDVQSIYNLGDVINVEVNVEPILEGRLFETDLVCNGNPVIKFNVFPDEEGNVIVKLPLNYFTIKEASGDCYFSGKYGDEIKQSRSFKISKRLNVILNIGEFYANPGEEIVISGTAKRLNGENVNGEIEISIPLIDLLNQQSSEETDANAENVSEGNESESNSSEETPNIDAGKFYGKVENGEFSVPFNLAFDTPAGDYRVEILVYENVGGVRASEEIVMSSLKIFQILTSVDIAVSSLNTDPGTDFNFKVRLLDQTGGLIEDEVSIIIKNELGERVYEKIVQSDDTVVYSIPTNLKAGYYEAEASSGEINSIKKFYVNEKAIVSFELINRTLIVTNVGNIPYKKDIEIELNGKPFIKKVDLELGESVEFKLTGTGEEYSIKVSDGNNEISEGGIVLTGNAIGVKEVGEGISLGLKTPIVWIFLIIILGAGILFLFRNIFKKKSFAYPFSEKFGKKKEVVKRDGEAVSSEKSSDNQRGSGKIGDRGKSHGALAAPSQAEQVLVLNGNKDKAAIVVLKIKNKISNAAKQSLEKSVEHVYSKRGAVYEHGDYIFIIFSPVLTKTAKNEVEAAKCAERIKLFLKEYNKKFKDKIEFGIGVGSGEIINKIENKKLKFTALGNFILAAKRLADSSDEQVLVTKEAYERGISEIKAEKKQIAGGNVYEVRQIIDHEKNQKFIQGFLERQKKEK